MKTEYILAGLAVAGIIGYQMYKGKLPSGETLMASTEDLPPAIQEAIKKGTIMPSRETTLLDFDIAPDPAPATLPVDKEIVTAPVRIINSGTSLVEPVAPVPRLTSTISPTPTVRTYEPVRTLLKTRPTLQTLSGFMIL